MPLGQQLDELLREQSACPGVVVGISFAGDRLVRGVGTAHIGTGQEMTAETAFQIGSVTKMLTTSLLLRQVERGAVSLDDRVVDLLPDFRLRDDGAGQITVAMLLNHTNGIDADSYFPGRVTGSDAVASYVADLRDRDTLFPPGSGASYSNPGFVVVGRVLETLGKEPFSTVVERDLFDPLGMQGAVTSADRAVLGRVAVGSFRNADGSWRLPPKFNLPPAAGPAGTTPIMTAADALAFAEMHLQGGAGYLDDDSVTAMRTATHGFGSPGMPTVGLGWMLHRRRDVDIVFHAGGSPGGTSQLVLVPEHELAIVAYGNSREAPLVFDRINRLVLDELHPGADDPRSDPGDPPDLAPLAGTYRAGDLVHHVRLGEEPNELLLESEFVAFDPDHAQTQREFFGSEAPPPQRLGHVGGGAFARTGLFDVDPDGLFARFAQVSFHGEGVPTHLHMNTRRSNRV